MAIHAWASMTQSPSLCIDCGSGSFSHEMTPPSTLFHLRNSYSHAILCVTSIKSMSTVHFPPIKTNPTLINAPLHNAFVIHTETKHDYRIGSISILAMTTMLISRTLHSTWTLHHTTVHCAHWDTCSTDTAVQLRPLVFAEQVNVFWLDRPPHRFM